MNATEVIDLNMLRNHAPLHSAASSKDVLRQISQTKQDGNRYEIELFRALRYSHMIYYLLATTHMNMYVRATCSLPGFEALFCRH
jgi:hypothetical protein